MPQRRMRERLVLLTLAGVVFLQFPLFSVAARAGGWWGLPWAAWYVFGVWGALIALAAAVVRRGNAGEGGDGR
jgi:hypothetical protein